jgi:hypothetical protein
MPTQSTRTVLLAGLAAGLLAGLLVGIFHFVATEPVIEAAIELESAGHPGAADEPPVVPRDVQRVGLVVGWVLYGLCIGLVFGIVYALVQPRFPGARVARNALLSALVAYWLVGLLPFLKYPANPPGVGEPETIAYRQTLFVLFWVLSVGGLVAASWAYRLLRPRLAGSALWLAVAGVYAAYTLVLFVAMPANPDPVNMPETLVAAFRGLALAGLTLFWLVLGAVFGQTMRRLDPSLR